MTYSPQQVSIVLADDHPVVLEGLGAILRAQEDMTVLASCPDGSTAIEAIRGLAPDIAVLDIAMPDLNGIQVLAALALDESSPTKVIMLTAAIADEQVVAAIDQGARGFLLKDAAPGALVRCVRAVMAGEQWFPPELIEGASTRVAAKRAERAFFQQRLSSRELDVVLLVADGLTNKVIGDRLGLTEGTIKIYLHAIYTKLNVPNRTTLAKLARNYTKL
jgi:DNA-binding NarL/FixJ family response regulator